MIKLFIKRKKEKAVRKLREELLHLIQNKLPEVFENEQHWVLKFVYFQNNQIFLQHLSKDVAYIEKNRNKNKDCYKLFGIEIYDNSINDFTPLVITISFNLISYLHISHENFFKKYDISKILIKDLIKEKVEMANSDEEIVRKILNGISIENQIKLELEDAMEVEFDEKIYYTIIDMENGNFVAIDKNKKVFRLLHDSSEKLKIIENNFEKFIAEYNGNKKTLLSFFD